MTVERLWPGSTVMILANGPSLTQADVDRCRGRMRVIAIKDAVRLAPWADVMYGCDAKYWKYYGPTLTFHGPRYALEAGAATWATPLRNTGITGLEREPSGLRTGKNSGYQAINLAVHLGASRILLLGFDMQADAAGRDHWFGAHPYNHNSKHYLAFLEVFPTIVPPLLALGIELVNCSRVSALTCVPRMDLETVLGEVSCAA